MPTRDKKIGIENQTAGIDLVHKASRYIANNERTFDNADLLEEPSRDHDGSHTAIAQVKVESPVSHIIDIRIASTWSST